MIGVVENSFKIDTFDYKEISERLLRGCIDAVTDLKSTGDWLDVAWLSTVHIELNVLSFVEFMIPYETTYCANSTTGEIVTPDYINLTPGHVMQMRMRDSMDRKTPIPEGRMWWDTYINLFETICHEFIHILQGHSGQIADKYSAEHDANFLSMRLLKEVSKRADVSDLFYPGLFEEICVHQLHSCRELISSPLWTELLAADYNLWIKKFGCVALSTWIDVPEDADAGRGFHIESQFARILTVEGYSPGRNSVDAAGAVVVAGDAAGDVAGEVSDDAAAGAVAAGASGVLVSLEDALTPCLTHVIRNRRGGVKVNESMNSMLPAELRIEEGRLLQLLEPKGEVPEWMLAEALRV